jgi:hypothetical protein
MWAASGTYTITWTMHDMDGDFLHASLFYSHDGGANWSPMAANLSSAFYPLDVSLLPGGSQVLFRVLVSDGLLTAIDTSDGPIIVPNKAPLVLLLGPSNNAFFSPGQTVLLRGAATDPEEGPIGGDRITWASDRDGPLGTGPDLAVSRLSPGWHRITASATDGSRAQGQASVRIFVGTRLFAPYVARGR